MTTWEAKALEYISTRGQAPRLSFDDVLLTGLAVDGGLYLPEAWPRLSSEDLSELTGRPYAHVAAEVMRPFLSGSCARETLDVLTARVYSHARFPRGAVCPLIQIDDGLWLLELFHGPTLAFKDVALQLLGDLFDHVLARRGEHITIIGATSGDTGSAAIEACRDRERVDIFMLHPRGRVSEVQRRQMTTVQADNVHNIAIEGTFDDCQALVKAMFNDPSFRAEQALSAVNSMNFARILAQTVYYVTAGTALGAPARPLAFSVPTGNFGDVYAGYAAGQMGLPLAGLVVACNRNDILARFFQTGTMRMDTVVETLSPSMDIQVSSNFERLLFDLLGRDGTAVTHAMDRFKQSGGFEVAQATLNEARRTFSAARHGDEQTLREIERVYAETGMLIDPHTAVGVAAARACRPAQGTPVVALATAHPAKFPDAVARATGQRPKLPARLASLYDREEQCAPLANDLKAVQDFIRTRSRRTAAHARTGP